jgi:hypothetical protein
MMDWVVPKKQVVYNFSNIFCFGQAIGVLRKTNIEAAKETRTIFIFLFPST